MTVLFCDLIGSTEHAERSDPEDVRALLSSYHERVRGELERFGGTVEKFIGDAVMAVFGAPVAHEDDPERAVRAALAIREWAREDGELQLRLGITTGEAIVTPRRAAGRGRGDGVRRRRQHRRTAPVGRAAERHRRRRDDVSRDGARDRVRRPARDSGEGKVDRGRVSSKLWRRRPASAWTCARSAAPSSWGEQRELEALVAALDRARREREPQLVTLIGVPGIGKKPARVGAPCSASRRSRDLVSLASGALASRTARA